MLNIIIYYFIMFAFFAGIGAAITCPIASEVRHYKREKLIQEALAELYERRAY